MSLPPMKSLESTPQISHEDSSAGANSSNVNSVNSVNNAANATAMAPANGQKNSTGQINTAAQDDPYRYGQMPSQAQAQQYPYYSSYPPGYGQQQQQQFQNQYPYYQAGQTANPAQTSATGATAQAGGSYPDYNNYSRMNYVQNYTPMYQGQMMAGGAGAGAGAMAGAAQPGAQAITTNATAGVGQVQPVGSRPRVTTTMWEDEKTLCYQVDANGVSVVRRADNNMINGTKLLNVAHMTRGRRDGILKSEKVRDVVKIGSMHLKGVWIPFERALAMAQREGIVDLLYPLFVRDIKQVIQQGSTTQPQANPAQQWGYQAGAMPAPAPVMQQPMPIQQPQMSAGAPATAGSGATSTTQQTAVKTSNSPYMTPTSLSNSSLTADAKNGATSQPQTAQQSTGAPQQAGQQNYYGAYPYYAAQYQYGYGAAPTNGAAATTAGATAATGAVGTGAAGAQNYQYPQYGGYGYMPQYASQPYDEQKDK